MRKKFGQNFLVNRRARQALVDKLSATPGDEVWEVGPGLGCMTDELLRRGQRVTAFEIDQGFIAALEELFGANENFSLVEGDALKTCLARENPQWFLGNLPYTIAATLLGSLIETGRLFKRMVLVVQRETALRMAASRGSKDYSSFSLLVQSVYQVQRLFDLKGAQFYPEPQVTSSAVLLERKDSAPADPALYRLIRLAFSSRRKTIKANLRSQYPQVEEVLLAAGLEPMARAENLSLEDYHKLGALLNG
jgi:16S rRNA (adenine1518-N6/adenine1519-N6)-dimethyltransferase